MSLHDGVFSRRQRSRPSSAFCFEEGWQKAPASRLSYVEGSSSSTLSTGARDWPTRTLGKRGSLQCERRAQQKEQAEEGSRRSESGTRLLSIVRTIAMRFSCEVDREKCFHARATSPNSDAVYRLLLLSAASTVCCVNLSAVSTCLLCPPSSQNLLAADKAPPSLRCPAPDDGAYAPVLAAAEASPPFHHITAEQTSEVSFVSKRNPLARKESPAATILYPAVRSVSSPAVRSLGSASSPWFQIPNAKPRVGSTDRLRLTLLKQSEAAESPMCFW
eukprot:scaffold3340_cov255-Pinguiococcus_pyrenoidosus.AAC.26